jgi:thioredoxin
MLNRRHALLAAVGALALGAAFTFTPLAQAAQDYSQQAFAAAQAAGKPILLHITAPWCPTCRAQKPIIGGIETQPQYKNLVVLNIDFDSQKDLLRKLRVNQQSTLIAYKGKTEVGRSVGETNPETITALVALTQ